MKRLFMSIAFSLLVVLSVGSVALAATTPTIHATKIRPLSVGGCTEHYGGPNNSFEMGVCISDRNTSKIYPDVYVNQQPIGPFSCTLYIELWNGNSKVTQDSGHPCVKGHYNASNGPYTIEGCLALHTSVWISYFGTFYRIGDSPTYTYCA